MPNGQSVVVWIVVCIVRDISVGRKLKQLLEQNGIVSKLEEVCDDCVEVRVLSSEAKYALKIIEDNNYDYCY